MNPYLLAVTTTTTTNAPPQPQVSVEVKPNPVDITTTLIGALKEGSFPIALIVSIVIFRYGGRVADGLIETLKTLRTDTQANRDAILTIGHEVDGISKFTEKHEANHADLKGSLDRLENACEVIITEVKELKKDTQSDRKPRGWF